MVEVCAVRVVVRTMTGTWNFSLSSKPAQTMS